MTAPWNRLPACVRPSATGIIVFFALVAVQACLGTSSGIGSEGPGGLPEATWTRSMGWPPSVVITGKSGGDGVTRYRVDVYWVTLLVMLGLTYFLAMPAGSLASRPHRRRHPAMVLLCVVAATLLMAFLAAILTSKALWGYYLVRPAPDRRIVEAPTVLSVTFVTTSFENDGRILVSDTSVRDAQRIHDVQPHDYYNLSGRVLVALKQRNRLPASPPPMIPERLAPLYGALDRTGRLEGDEPGYSRAKELHGAVIEAIGADGSPLVFVGVQGGEVSNDHYPYYEFLFSGSDPEHDLKLLSAQRFYFDVAGIEGMEWYVFFAGFSALGIVLTVPLTLLLLAVWPARAPSSTD